MAATLPRAADRHNEHMAESLKGSLLIAAPSLFDYFRRAVVLLLEHSDEGGMGVVLNRSSETTVAEAGPPPAGLAGGEELGRLGGAGPPGARGGPGGVERATEA